MMVVDTGNSIESAAGRADGELVPPVRRRPVFVVPDRRQRHVERRLDGLARGVVHHGCPFRGQHVETLLDRAADDVADPGRQAGILQQLLRRFQLGPIGRR